MFEYYAVVKQENNDNIIFHSLFDSFGDALERLENDVKSYDPNYKDFKKSYEQAIKFSNLTGFLKSDENITQISREIIDDIKNNPLSIVKTDESTVLVTKRKIDSNLDYQGTIFPDDPQNFESTDFNGNFYCNGNSEFRYETEYFEAAIINNNE